MTGVPGGPEAPAYPSSLPKVAIPREGPFDVKARGQPLAWCVPAGQENKTSFKKTGLPT